MTRNETADTTVLIVEDERRLADVFADSLAGEHAVRTAYTGREALEALGPAVDVVLLDRRLPDVSGSEILAAIQERGLDPAVAVVSAVEPGEEALSLDIDAYVRKPVSCSELRELVAELLARQELDAAVQAHLALRSKRRAIEAGRSAGWQASSPRYQELLANLTERETALPGEALSSRSRPRTHISRF
jgi:DNA-binding response OmpR family regulator